MPKAHGKSEKPLGLRLKQTIKAYAKTTSHEMPKAHGKSEKTFWAPLKTNNKSICKNNKP